MRAFFWNSNKTESNDSQTNKNPTSIMNTEEKFNELFDFTSKNFPIKIGNKSILKSNLGFWKRRKYEKQILYPGEKTPPFLYTYRSFIKAFKDKDFKLVKGM